MKLIGRGDRIGGVGIAIWRFGFFLIEGLRLVVDCFLRDQGSGVGLGIEFFVCDGSSGIVFGR